MLQPKVPWLRCVRAPEAVRQIVRINILARDNPRRVDGKRQSALKQARARPGRVECGYRAGWVAEEAVTYVAGVHVVARDSTPRADRPSQGPLGVPRARAGRVEGSYRASGGTHEAVTCAALLFTKGPRDGSRGVDRNG